VNSPVPYVLRHTFASNALAAGVGTFELARVMGTSLEMIERTYGHLVRGADDAFRSRLDAFAAQREESGDGREHGSALTGQRSTSASAFSTTGATFSESRVTIVCSRRAAFSSMLRSGVTAAYDGALTQPASDLAGSLGM